MLKFISLFGQFPASNSLTTASFQIFLVDFSSEEGYLPLSKCICTNSSQKFFSDKTKSGKPKSQYILMFPNKPGEPLKVVDAQNGNFNRTSFVDTTY